MNLNKSKTKKSEIFRLVYNAARATNNTIRFRHRLWGSTVFAYSLKHTMQDGGWYQDWR